MLDEAKEYTRHRQCQTCLASFQDYHGILNHVEGYRHRERLLAAKLERCRMHAKFQDDIEDIDVKDRRIPRTHRSAIILEEFAQHRQCQTCFSLFQSNQDLLDHIEEYRHRERLLAVELEQCKLHADGSNHIDEHDDPESVEEQANREPALEFACPFRDCQRLGAFTTQSNLMRQFRTHYKCYEICPLCHGIITRLDRFLRHECAPNEDLSKIIYLQRRTSYLNAKAREKLSRLKGMHRKTGKRRHAGVESRSIRQQRMRTAGEPVFFEKSCRRHQNTDNTHVLKDDVATYSAQAPEPCDAATSGEVNSEFPVESTTTELLDQGWAFALEHVSGTAGEEWGAWAFAESNTNVLGGSGGWAYDEAHGDSIDDTFAGFYGNSTDICDIDGAATLPKILGN